MNKHKSIHFNLPAITHDKLKRYAQHIGDVSESGRPKVTTAIKRTIRAILELYANDEFQQKLKEDGGDPLSYIQRCVRRNISE